MRKFRDCTHLLKSIILLVLLASGTADAQYFTSGKGDLLAGFRKPGTGTYELVVNIGNVTNLLAQSPGVVVPIGRFSASQLSDAFSDYNNLQWSVSFGLTGAPNSVWSGFQVDSMWFTLPRDNSAVQTTPPARRSKTSQVQVVSEMVSIANGANALSSRIGTTNADNNLYLVREPVGDANSLSTFIGNPTDASIGDFAGNMPATVENTTPSSFSSPVVSDLYQSVPTGNTDPNSGTTSGAAYYVGYFTLNSNGSMTFTRASSVVSNPPPPAPQILSITRSNNVSTVSFTTTNGAAYTLLYTNASGLTAPVATWATGSSMTGDGGTDSLSDATTDTNRFYRISAH